MQIGAATGPDRRQPLVGRVRRRVGMHQVRWLLGVFVASRVLYWLLGVRFDDSLLSTGWQLLDLSLLQDDLWSSLYYLHSQPPLFNAFVGVVSQLPVDSSPVFHLTYLGMGVCLLLLTRDLALRLGASSGAAFVASTFVVCSPTAVLYENYLFNTYPIALLLVASADAFHRWVEGGRARALAALVGSVAAVTLLRSAFHPVLLVAVVVLALLARRPAGNGYRVAAACALPLLLVGLLFAKNVALFGQASFSSWLGMNFWRPTGAQLPIEERTELVRRGDLHRTATVDVFEPWDRYEPLLGEPCRVEHVGVAALERPDKTNGEPNFNYECYRGLSDDYLADSTYVVTRKPGVLAGSTAYGIALFTLPSSLYPPLEPNRARLGWIDEVSRRVLMVHVGPSDFSVTPGAISPPEGVSLVVIGALLAAFRSASRAVRRWRRGQRDPWTCTMVFISGLIVWVAVVGNLFELGENQRFRFEIDPLLFVLLACAVTGHLSARPPPPQRAIVDPT